MVNIWDYADMLPRVRLKSDDGKVFEGDILCITDAEEADDEDDSLSLEMDDGRIIRFYPNEIASIDVL